jgi:diaminopimelate decarboxylase
MTVTYRSGLLHLDNLPIDALADQFGTPLYAYSKPTLIESARTLDAALTGHTPHLICYAVKANPNLAIIQTFAQLGFGADVTSGGELFRAIQAGVPLDRIVYSGVGKTSGEINQAIEAQIKAFHVESEAELHLIASIAHFFAGSKAPIALRVNVDVDPHTHPNISTGKQETKFGIAWESVPALIQQIKQTPSLRLIGLSVHIGSQITELQPYREAADRIVGMARILMGEGLPLEYIDFGGGLGVRYSDESPPTFAEWGRTLRDALGDLPLTLVVEPGRSLVASAGVLITRVLYVKQTPTKTFVIVDAGMNDLIRPMLYGAHHPIWPVTQRENAPKMAVDIVGPVCETTDIFASQIQMPLPESGDLLAILHAGAYGSSMASNYNSRLRAAEIMIDQAGTAHIIRQRETLDDLIRGEHFLP